MLTHAPGSGEFAPILVRRAEFSRLSGVSSGAVSSLADHLPHLELPAHTHSFRYPAVHAVGVASVVSSLPAPLRYPVLVEKVREEYLETEQAREELCSTESAVAALLDRHTAKDGTVPLQIAAFAIGATEKTISGWYRKKILPYDSLRRTTLGKAFAVETAALVGVLRWYHPPGYEGLETGWIRMLRAINR